MNLFNFFEFLEDKESRRIPGRARLVFDPNYIFNIEDFEDENGDVDWSEDMIQSISDVLPLDNLIVKGDLILYECYDLESLPRNLSVGGSLNVANCPNLELLPKKLKVGNELNLVGCSNVQSLPNNLVVGGMMDLSFCRKLQSLPNNLKVGGDLYLYDCKNIQSLPKDLEVGGNLNLVSTLIADKYTKEQIRKMIPRVEGKIYIHEGDQFNN